MELLLATEQDKGEIWCWYHAAMRSHIEQIWGWKEAWQVREFNDHFLELRTSFVMLDHKKVGYIQYRLTEQETYLQMLVLNPEYQRQGLGVRVLDKLQMLQPNKPLRLRCFQVNRRALKFYVDNGFRQLQHERHFVLLERHGLIKPRNNSEETK